MSQKPHLDDFFAAARRSEPVISHEEIGELIDARHTELPSTTHHITWKGISMTTVGLGLAAVLSYFAFFTSESNITDLTAVPPASSALRRQSSVITPELKTLVAPGVEATKQQATVTEVSERVTPKEALRVEAPIKVDEVRITEPSEGDMKRLGMKVDGGREVVVVQKVGKKFYVVTYGAKPFRVSSQLEEENPTDIEPSETLPVFVTNLDGTGILTAMAPDEHTSILTKEIHTSDEDNNTREHTVERTQTNIIVHGDQEDANIDISTDIHVAVPPSLMDQSNFSFTIDSSSSIEAFAADGKAVGQTKIFVKRGNEDINIDVASDGEDEKVAKQMRKEVRIAINKGEGMPAINIKGLDSIHKKVMVAHLFADSQQMDMQEFMKGMDLMKDSLVKLSKDIRIHIDEDGVQANMEQLIKDLHHAKKELRVSKEFKKPGMRVGVLPGLKGHAKMYALPGFNDLKAKVKDLVPMRIALNDNKGKGLIFWYEPAAAPVIPKQETQSVSTSSFENITINPNPAQNHTTVRFTLKDANAVTISVHDILGKRLLEAGQVTADAGGAFTHELDLSSLTQGVYLVVLTTDTGEQRIERILVNK